ncbi:hypothetical protein Hanom_Chr09g00866131 [Helianthus anomalus]
MCIHIRSHCCRWCVKTFFEACRGTCASILGFNHTKKHAPSIASSERNWIGSTTSTTRTCTTSTSTTLPYHHPHDHYHDQAHHHRLLLAIHFHSQTFVRTLNLSTFI